MRLSVRLSYMLLALISIIFMFTSCSSKKEYFSSALQPSEKADSSFHTASGQYDTVAKSSYAELAIDKKNHSISVRDRSENHTWSALLQAENDYSYAFSVTLFTDSGCYILNTQDHSVAYSASSYKKDGNTVTVSYTLSNNKETAEKKYEEMTADDIFVILEASYTLNEQSVTLNINAEKIKCTEKGIVSTIEILPFFGSGADSSNDWFLIPDNSGAIMYTALSDNATQNISVNIYGENPCISTDNEAAAATIPAFGIKRNSSAVCAVITDGDAMARIIASRKTADKASQIYPVVTITETDTDGPDKIVSGAQYNGNITVSYHFLSGSNATYSSMASATREALIETSRLSSSTVKTEKNLPFSLTIIGAEGINALTTTEQTIDILDILKGKGINNIMLSYKGLYSGGIEKGSIYSSGISKRLGGSKGLEELYIWAEKQGCTLLQGVNVISQGKKSSGNINTLNSGAAVYSQKNDLAYNENNLSALKTRIGNDIFSIGKEKTDKSIYSQKASFELYPMSASSFQASFRQFLSGSRLEHSDGITVTDAGRVLSSELQLNRQKAMSEVASMLGAVANYGTLAVEGGNLYSLYNASLITDMNFDTYYQESEAYASVPFVQSVLHGTVLYTGTPIDAGNPLYRYDMLRYIEYGAVPAYEWIYENVNVYCYNGYLLSERITETVDFYNNACEMLSDLADDRITGHREITADSDGKPISGVYCTEYSDGTEIYVNYTGNIVTTPGNIAVGPYDYVKVRR